MRLRPRCAYPKLSRWLTRDSALLSLTIACPSFTLKVLGSRAALRDNGREPRFGGRRQSTVPARLPNDFARGGVHPRLWNAQHEPIRLPDTLTGTR